MLCDVMDMPLILFNSDVDWAAFFCMQRKHSAFIL